jgi:hypothetical protein
MSTLSSSSLAIANAFRLYSRAIRMNSLAFLMNLAIMVASGPNGVSFSFRQVTSVAPFASPFIKYYVTVEGS